MPPPQENLEDLLARCEQEPIHIPGAIQPFGVLLAVDPEHLLIHNASENTASLWGVPATDLIGRDVARVLLERDRERMHAHLRAANPDETSPLTVTLSVGNAEQEWEVRVQPHDELLFLEFEPVQASRSSGIARSLHGQLRDTVRALQEANSVHDLCDKAVRHVRRITGFDRVMVYRFDADWHGFVFAEACAPGVQSYLGHHFPASDIPPPARAIFTSNWLRMIPKVDYEPVPICPATHPVSGEPLDLGRVLLRSVSPIHLEYLRNMDVAASITVSLLDNGRLWGLIACHHETPLLVDSDGRTVAELVGRLVSAQLGAKQADEERADKRRLEAGVDEMLQALGCEASLGQSLEEHAENLCAMLHAGGLAVRYGGRWRVAGKVPAAGQLDGLLAFLQDAVGEEATFQTNRLPHCFPEAQAYRNVASGLLALFLSRAEGSCVLWFRREVDTTLTWAGEPGKVERSVKGMAGLRPRTSFAAWTQHVAGTSQPWTGVEVDAARRLRIGLLAIALDQEHARERAARMRAERLSREKDEMVMMVSHDLKTPLNVISLSLEFLRQAHPSQDPPVQRMLERGERAAGMMELLITNILDIAKIEAGTLNLDLKPDDPVRLVRDVVEVLVPLATERSVRLAADLPDTPVPSVMCERFRIVQVLNNLMSNALKFTPPGGTVSVSLSEQADEVIFHVSDTGTGMKGEDLARVFVRFWQREETSREGSGLGLWISKALIEMHGGSIGATSEPGKGSVFSFALKKAPPQ